MAKSPRTSSVLEPATFRLVARSLNHYATACPFYQCNIFKMVKLYIHSPLCLHGTVLYLTKTQEEDEGVQLWLQKSSTLTLKERYHVGTTSEADKSTRLPHCRSRSAKAHCVSRHFLNEKCTVLLMTIITTTVSLQSTYWIGNVDEALFGGLKFCFKV
jgi:hypothetical protein